MSGKPGLYSEDVQNVKARKSLKPGVTLDRRGRRFQKLVAIPPTAVHMRQDKGQVRHRHARLDLNNPPTAVSGIQVTSRRVCRLDLNNPPTAVSGIQVTSRRVCRLDLNNPPTAVGGISVRLTMVRLNLAHMDGRRWIVHVQPTTAAGPFPESH
jgi:hypothetical protein